MSAVLMTAVLAGLPAQPAAADEKFEQPKSVGNKNTTSGSASDVGVATAKADEADKPVEIKSLRTETETFFANPDGSIRRDVAQSPIRAENAAGNLVTISTELTEEGDRLAPEATTGDVSFSGDGDGAAATYAPAEGQQVSLSFDGDLGEPEIDGALATYPVQGEADQSVQVYARGDGFASRVVLAAAPEQAPAREPQADEEPSVPAAEDPADPDAVPESTPAPEEANSQGLEFRFDVDVKGLTPSLKDGVLSFADAKGELVAQSSPLQMWDSRTDEAGDVAEKLPVDADLERDADGDYTLVLRPSMEFLSDPETVYPVVVDPDISATLNGDTYYYSDQSSTPLRGQEPILRVGSDNGTRKFQSLLQWNARSIYGLPVMEAELKLFQYFSGGASCGPTTMNLYPTTETALNTWWGNKPPIDNSARFSSSKAFSRGVNSSCPAGQETIDVTAMVNAWGSGQSAFYDSADPRGRQGIQLQAANELSTASRKHFCSQDPDNAHPFCKTEATVPKLSITYAPEVGVQDWYSMTDHRLNDRSSFSVNNKNGNAVVSAGDASLNGVGLDVEVSRTYNSQSTVVSSMGPGWSLGLGSDVWLEKKSPYRYDYHAPGGTVMGSFIRKSATPSSNPDNDYNKFETPLGGARAELTQNGQLFTLKFRGNRTTYQFNDENPGDDHAYLEKIKDRSDNTINVGYDGSLPNGKPKMTRIIGSGGQELNVTYGTGSSANYVTQLSQTYDTTASGNATTRTWKYGYNSSGYLTSYEDANKKVTDYTYTSMSAPANVLETITAPVNNSGYRPKTKLEYGVNGGLEINQLKKAYYYYNDPNDNNQEKSYIYAWEYKVGDAQQPPACKNNGNYFTVVTDPNDKKTTYCYQSRSDPGGSDKTWVYNARGDERSTEYTADNGPTNITSTAAGATGGSGSTSVKYSDGFADRVDSITEPKNKDSSSNVASSSGFEYQTPTSVAGGSYLPSAARTGSNDCNRYGYDSKGRTTTAYTGISTSTSTLACNSSSSADAEYHVDYNDNNGTIAKTWDGNSGSSPTDADKTIYTYWMPGDTGLIAGSAGQVKTIRKPGGDCSTGASRKLCSSFTYDGAARVTSITDGRGIRTNYVRDDNDRTTEVHYNNGNTSTCLLGLSSCLKYTYDAEGNLVQRSGTETSTFAFDRLNRMITQTVPAASSGNDTIGMAYDGVGNLTTFTQALVGASAAHTVTYGYDAANQLNEVTEGGETTTITTDKDGRTQSIKFPKPTGSNGAVVEYDYYDNGRPQETRIETFAGAETAKVAYDYDKTITVLGISVTIDTPQLQSRNVSKSNYADQQGTTDYSYSKQRLTSATDSNGTNYAYEYDKIGNLTKEDAGSTTTHYGYDRAGELCWRGPNTGTKLAQTCPTTPSGNTTVPQDAAGNSLGSSTNSYTVNDRNQVTGIDGTTMSYLDQGNDLRANNGPGREINSPLGISAVRNGSTITYLIRDPAGTILATRTGTFRTNFVTEPNGNVSWLLTTAGTQIAAYKYAPYGATTGYGGTTANTNRFRWLGAPQNTTSTGGDGHYKLGARYNDTHAHFTQADPVAGGIGDPRTMTSYNYGGGDPINSSDASGYGIEDTLNALETVGSVIDVYSACANTAGYGRDVNCSATVNGVVVGAAATGVCAVPAVAYTYGLGAPACLVIGPAAGGAANLATRVLDRVF